MVLAVAVAFTLLSMFVSEFFWFFPDYEPKTNQTEGFWVPHRARWIEWKVRRIIERRRKRKRKRRKKRKEKQDGKEEEEEKYQKEEKEEEEEEEVVI